jgi:hypothetical protein
LDYNFKIDEKPEIKTSKSEPEKSKENLHGVLSFDYWKVYFDVDVDMLQERYMKFVMPKESSLGYDIKQ